MAEKDTIYSSKIKHSGIFSFSGFYKFCYNWLTEDGGYFIVEDTYSEKINGDSKDIDISWKGTRKVTDYFKFEVKVKFKILGLKKVEVTRSNGIKEKTNQGNIELKITGTLIRDYQGKFESSGFQKTLRGFYEKYIMKSRIDEMEDKLIDDCTSFLEQAKAWLDLEGKK